jgi:hypothetical protein
MIKYKVEDNIDFFLELNKALNETENDSENKYCLISNTILQDNYVTLDCGHKFNYLPLYNDILNHKKKYNNMECLGDILKINQIRCPYCRNKQNFLLPYYEMDGVNKIHGVNFIDYNDYYYNNFFIDKCSYKICNIYYDEKMGEGENNNKYYNCNNTYVIKLKEDGCNYCVHHKYIAYKQAIRAAKLKQKEEEKTLKLQLKEKAKLIKIQQKKEDQLLKLKEKQEAKLLQMNLDENIILCSAILKTGKNKGLPCGKKACDNNKCKIHNK